MPNLDTMKFTSMTRLRVFKRAFVTLLLASCGVKTEGQTPFKKFEFRHCPADLISDAMYVGTDVTITKCVKMCALRPWCAALLYRRQYPLCELFSTNGLKVLETIGVAGYCQYVDQDNFSAELVHLRLECSTLAKEICPEQYIACDLDRKQCTTPECPRLNVTHGRLLGNMNNNGSRKQVTCNPDYIEVPGTNPTTCIDGNWMPKPQCIVKPCFSNPCQNGGTCVDNRNSHFCLCPPWWKGTNCETFSDPVYCGCYDDKGVSVLPYAYTTSNTNTPYECAKHCSRFNYAFAGVENGSQCFCGNVLDATKKRPNTDCNNPCPGDSSKMCGDYKMINVYGHSGDLCRTNQTNTLR